MKDSVGAAHARIYSIGEHRAARLVTNDDLAATLDTNDEWIRTRTGIASRRLAAPDETVVSMAVDAGAKALAQAGLTAAEVDLLLLATCTMPTPIPSAAPEVADRIGATGIGAADVNAACGGFCYTLALAADAIRSGSARRVLVIASERLSDWTDWTDRSTAILFADGAAAVVVGPAEEAGIGPVAWGSDGGKARLIAIEPGTTALRMSGQQVFRWTSTTLTPVARRACELAGVSPADLDAVVPHQANLRIVETVVRGLGATRAAVARDVIETGNTSAASVPLALARMVATGEAPSGGLALLLAFGAGLTYAGQVVRIP
ncbi:MAG: beta-ketoacyl-ACP synthase III [Mycobacteriales bacterium]